MYILNITILWVQNLDEVSYMIILFCVSLSKMTLVFSWQEGEPGGSQDGFMHMKKLSCTCA